MSLLWRSASCLCDNLMLVSEPHAQCRSTTCWARWRKYGIHPMPPSDRAIFRPGNFTNTSLNIQLSIAAEVRTPTIHAKLTSIGVSAEISGTTDDDPTCMQTMTLRSSQARHTGSQYLLGSKSVGRPSGAGFSEK